MTKLEERFEEFNELLLSIVENGSYKQKKYAKKLLEDLFLEMKIQEKRIYDLNQVPEDQYTDVLFKAINILQLLGITQADFDVYHKKYIDWLQIRLSTIKKTINVNQLNEYRKLYNLYCDDHGDEPEKLIDLKKLITEYELDGYTETTAGK